MTDSEMGREETLTTGCNLAVDTPVRIERPLGGWFVVPTHPGGSDGGVTSEILDRNFPLNYASGIRGRILTLDPRPRWWMQLGVAPRPATRWQRFQLHVGHGLVMRYPLRHVLGFAVRGLFWRMPEGPASSDIDAGEVPL